MDFFLGVQLHYAINLDNSFKGTLRFLAKLGGKKVMFIELDDVARLIEGNSVIDV